MRVKMGYIKAVALLVLVVFLFGFAKHRYNSRKINEVLVEFKEGENLYVTEQAVNKLLKQNNVDTTSISKESLDLNRVETLLNDHDMIENAEVYLNLTGELRADIIQRKPIGRVVGNSSFYLDKNGLTMPLSSHYSARVPLLFGFNKENAVEVFPLVNYITKDEFLNHHITGINRLPNGKYDLAMRKLDFVVYFGTTENIELKFNNFKAFYKKALKEDKLNDYRKVNLQFGDQVVCTKK